MAPQLSHFHVNRMAPFQVHSFKFLFILLSAELQVRMFRSCRFLLFLPHKYQVSLNEISQMFDSIPYSYFVPLKLFNKNVLVFC